jgi:hypothetical protein
MGVCGGIAHRYGWSSTAVRLATIIVPGFSVIPPLLVYFLLRTRTLSVDLVPEALPLFVLEVGGGHPVSELDKGLGCGSSQSPCHRL